MRGDDALSGRREVTRHHAQVPRASSKPKPITIDPERDDARHKSHQIKSSRHSRTCILGNEAGLREDKTPLSGDDEECHQAIHHLRLEESLSGEILSVDRNRGN